MIVVGDEFAEAVSNHLELEFMSLKRRVFPDGEVCPRISSPEKVTGNDVIFAMRISRPFDPNRYLVETLLTLRNLKSYGASKVYAVIPYFPYSRQDKILISGEPLSVAFVKEAIGALSELIFSVETHSKIDGVINISVSDDLASFLKKHEIDLVAGPDKGSSNLVKSVAKKLGVDYVCLEKTRNPSTGSISITYKGERVDGKNIALVDDILSSGGTLKMAADILKSHGASKILGCIVHPILVGNWKEINVEELAATNTIPSEISVIDVTKTVAEALKKKIKI